MLSGLVTGTAMAQQWIPNFKHFTIRDGLPSSEVYQITSDAQKNLWFVTDRGVVRYDGYLFKVYDNKNSLPDNSVIKVYKDYKNRVWFISFSGLLSYYENEKIIPYKYNNIISFNLGAPIFTSLFVDEHETIFLNSLSAQIHRIDSSGNYSGSLFTTDTATFTIIDTGRVATFSTQASHMHASNLPLTRFRIQSTHKTQGFTINQIISYQHFATTKLRNGDLIFYCGQALIRIRPDGSHELTQFKTPVLNVFEDNKSNLWIGCYHDGVYVYDSSMQVSSHYLTDFSVSHTYADYEGGLWLSTLENGIFYLPEENNMSFVMDGNVFREKITAIEHISDSVLVFATSNGYLYKFNDARLTVDKIELKKEADPAIEFINSLYYLKSRKKLIVGTNSTIKTLDRIASLHRMGLELGLHQSTTRLIVSDNNHMLGCFYTFVYLLDVESLASHYLHKELFHARALFRDSQGRLLAGALDGLYLYQDSNFVLLDSTKSILRSRVTDINELNRKYLVIATRSNGIILLSDSASAIITHANGLVSDNINRLIVDGNTIWASTNRGLNRIIVTNYHPLTYTVQVYNISTGLPSDEINDFTLTKNNIYVATNEGVSLVKIQPQNNAPGEMPLHISSIKINDEDTTVLTSYALNHKQNTFNITFAAVSFKYSKNIVYLYRLLGLDTIWRSTSNRDVQFTNLSPGKYKFQLLAQSGENAFSSTPLEIDFDISSPFYQAIWFRLTAAFVFWVILFALISLRIQAIKKKAEVRNELNRKFSELNLNALRSQMNPHFTFNVLNSIQYYIAKKDSESAQLYITKFARLIRMILDQSRTEFISLSEEIRILTLYIELEELRFEKKFSYTINVDAQINISGIYIPGMLIQPFVENSIKHGIRFKKGEAHVDVDFKTSGSILICTITDNGIGRDAAAKLKPGNVEFKSVGTDIVQERIEALGILFKGKLKNYITDLTDEYGNPAGTRVTVEVPYKTFLS